MFGPIEIRGDSEQRRQLPSFVERLYIERRTLWFLFMLGSVPFSLVKVVAFSSVTWSVGAKLTILFSSRFTVVLFCTMAQMVHFFTSIRILNSEFRILNSEF